MRAQTKVIFRVFRNGEVIALFPELPGNSNPSTCNSYMHVGQHGAAAAEALLPHTRLATRSESASLARELRGIGYRLRVVRRFTRADYYKRREAL